MKQSIVQYKSFVADKITGFKSNFKSWRNLFFGQMIFGILLYLFFMANELTNTADGLWGCYYRAGDVEISSGRWVWPYLDDIRKGISTEPVTTIITLSLISIGNFFIVDILGALKSKIVYLMSFMILSNTVLTNWLSYRFMSPTFGVSYLVSLFVAWLITKGIENNSKRVILINYILAAFMTAVFLGCYQASLGCTCLLVLIYTLVMVLENKSYKEIISRLISAMVSLMAGFVIYKIIWDIYLKVKGLSAGAYQGANNVSVGRIFFAIPESTVKCYKIFYNFFFSNNDLHNIYQDNGVYGIYCMVTVIVLGSILIVFMRKTNKADTLMVLLVVYALIPIFTNSTLYLAIDASTALRMYIGMALVFPCLFVIFDRGYKSLEHIGREEKILKFVSIFSGLVLLIGNIYMVEIDIDAMYDGRKATYNLFDSVIEELKLNDEYSMDKTYVFVGTLSENPTFYKSRMWSIANSYAKYGQVGFTPLWGKACYNALLENYGESLQLSPSYEYENMYESEYVADMPLFPEEGSIQEIDDCVVIKLSNSYTVEP